MTPYQAASAFIQNEFVPAVQRQSWDPDDLLVCLTGSQAEASSIIAFRKSNVTTVTS